MVGGVSSASAHNKRCSSRDTAVYMKITCGFEILKWNYDGRRRWRRNGGCGAVRRQQLGKSGGMVSRQNLCAGRTSRAADNHSFCFNPSDSINCIILAFQTHYHHVLWEIQIPFIQSLPLQFLRVRQESCDEVNAFPEERSKRS